MKVEHTKNHHLHDVAEYFAKHRVSIGFFDTAKYPDGTPVAYIAAIQEFGYPEGNIPSRPFFRNAIKGNADEWKLAAKKLLLAAIEGRLTPEQALNQLGLLSAGDVRKSIIDGDFDALKDSTLKARQYRKRTPGVAEKPLIDTAQMMQSISYQIGKTGRVIPLDEAAP